MAGTPSSWRPPWLETRIAFAPCSTALRASSAVRIPFAIHGSRSDRPQPVQDLPARSGPRAESVEGALDLGSAGWGHDVRPVADRDGRVDREPAPRLPVPDPEHGSVDREHERGVAGAFRPLHQPSAHVELRLEVQLEPARSGTGGGRDLLDRGRGESAVRGGPARPQGGPSDADLAVRVDLSMIGHGRNEDGSADVRPEERRGRVGRRDSAQHRRKEGPFEERRPVRPQGAFLAGAPLEVSPDPRRKTARRRLFEIAECREGVARRRFRHRCRSRAERRPRGGRGTPPGPGRRGRPSSPRA